MEELLITTKSVALVYFFLLYCLILFWVLRKKNRTRLEEHRFIPFADDHQTEAGERCRKK